MYEKLIYLIYMIFAAGIPVGNKTSVVRAWRRFFARKIIRHCGKDVNIQVHAHFTPKLSIDDRSSLGANCVLYGSISIGKNVMMGPEVFMTTVNHRHDSTEVPMIEQGYEEEKPIVIKDDVWIGRRAMIMPGVTIEKGTIIAAGAVVTKSTPPFSIVGGVPAKVLKMRENIEKKVEK